MPAFSLQARRIRLIAIAGCICLFAESFAGAASRHSKPQTRFDHAARLRESLENRPEGQRTRRDYQRVMDAYRAIYHADPASPHAPSSVFAVADLLAEEGRVLSDDKSFHDAIGQYEFLRTNYPHSSYRQSALLAEGEIYLHDLNDAAGARSAFKKYLKLYPNSQDASEARIELRDLRHPSRLASKRTELARDDTPKPSPVFTATPRRAHPSPKHDPPAVTTVAKAPVHHEPLPPQPIEDARESAPAVSRTSAMPLVTGIRYWSTPIYTRVAIDLQDEVRYEAIRVSGPDRIFFDLYGARLSPKLVGQSDHVIDEGFLHRIHAEQFSSNVTRVVLDISDVSQYYAFFLPNPARLVIDIRARRATPQQEIAASAAQAKPNRSRRSSPQDLALIHAIGLGSATIPDDEIAGPLPADSRPVGLRVRATPHPTTAPVEQTFGASAESRAEVAAARRPVHSNQQKAQQFYAAPQPTANGQLSMVRALGLKINRIVIDAGHGGHDSGTLGPDGMEEKNVVLDVALRLGALLRQRLGADVIYTRDNDTFIPLETRTAIANKAQADLFISIHANSSPDPSARGVETYYLSFTTSEDALEVAARENAVSNQSIHQLSDLVKKIALQDKLEESRELADDVQQSIYQGLEPGNPGLRDRGVKKAPFVVLIGANMPSILTEISFLTNPEDANELRQPQYRERIAEALYRGVAHYVGSLNGVRVADAASGAPAGKSE